MITCYGYNPYINGYTTSGHCDATAPDEETATKLGWESECDLGHSPCWLCHTCYWTWYDECVDQYIPEDDT